MPSAWDIAEEKIGDLGMVRIGLIDNEFDTEHEDLNFRQVWNNPSDIIENHGTHVAGTMAAGWNNNAGVTGIIPKHRLYGYSILGERTDEVAKRLSTMHLKYALALLIGNNVKVINYSMGWPDAFVRACTTGVTQYDEDDDRFYTAEFSRNYVQSQSKIVERFLLKLMGKNYDFVIVTSAGNANGLGHSLDNDLANAIYDCEFAFISNPQIRNRVIVVGSIRNRSSETIDEQYFLSNFSCENGDIARMILTMTAQITLLHTVLTSLSREWKF